MQFTYNSVTIGGSSSKIIGKPVFSGNRDLFTIAFKFLLQSSSESGFFSTYIDYKNKLEKPGQVFVLSSAFTISPSDSDNYGTALTPSLEIIGADTDTFTAKTCQYTIGFRWNNLISDYRNIEHSVTYSAIGKKTVTINLELSKNGETSALDNFKENVESVNEVVLNFYGYSSGTPNYRLVSWTIGSTDPLTAEGSHEIDYITVNAVYEQVFFNQEKNELVSTTLINSNLQMTPIRFIDWNIQQNDTTIRERIAVSYSTQVKIDSEKAGGDEEPYNYEATNEVTDLFLQEVFEELCLPRIEQMLADKEGTFELLDGDINFNPSNSYISANLVYDNQMQSIISIAENIITDTIYGFEHKVLDVKRENDQVFVEYPGVVTYVNITSTQEFWSGQNPINISYVPANAKILRRKVTTGQGQSRMKSFKNGIAEYQTTTIQTSEINYVISKFELKETSKSSDMTELENEIEYKKAVKLPKYDVTGGF